MTANNSGDCDLISSFLNLGPFGTNLPVQLKIPYGLNPGSILFITAKCENRMCIKIKDDTNNIVQCLEIWVNKNEISVKDKCSTDSANFNETFKARISLTSVCESEGYRIFINGKQVEYLKKNYTNNISLLEISDCQIYKVTYITIVFENKENDSTISQLKPDNKDDSNNKDEITDEQIKKETSSNSDSNKNNNDGDREDEEFITELPQAE